jgi:hypothetical protein
VFAFDGISEIMTTFRQHAYFNNVEINALDARINKWSIDWIKLAGREGMMKYLHVTCSCHMIAYLRRWKNLSYFLTRDGIFKMHPFDRYITIEANTAGLLVNAVGAALRSSLSECGFCGSCGG